MSKTTYRLAVLATAASLFFVNVNAFASETDDRIESSIKQSYVFKTYLRGDDIKVKSTDSVVTLTGTVSDDSHRLLAEDTVASLPGIKNFDNKLEVKGDNPAQYSDMWLSIKVQSTLMFYRSLSATKIEVLATNGIITLRGEATSTAQKDLATEYTKDIEGVKDVKNEMTLSPVVKKLGEKTLGHKIDVIGEVIDDASITALVKTTLLYHRSTSALKTIVETKEGVVSLAGKAKNSAEKELATKFVSDVHGVKMVLNNMTIE